MTIVVGPGTGRGEYPRRRMNVTDGFSSITHFAADYPGSYL